MFSLKPKSSSPSDTAELRSSKRFEVNQRVLIRSLDAASAGCHGVITNVSEWGMRIRSDDSQFSPNDPVQIEWRGKQIFGIVRHSLDRDSTSYLGIKVYHS